MFWGFAHGAWFLLPLFLLGRLFWLALLVLLIVGLVRWFSRRRQVPAFTFGAPPAQPSALEILCQRYARGEIDATTFDQMRERLEGSSQQKQQ